MLFNGHTMTMVTDPRFIGNEINNRDFVSVAAVTTDNDQITNHPNVYNASILMPPTDLLMRWADGDQLALNNEYPRYLSEYKDCDDMIVALLAALTTKNIIIYIPINEFNIFGQMLLNHFYYMYGITMNTPTTIFAFNETKLPFLLSKFYMMDLMEPKDFIESYPFNMQLPPFVINKLAEEVKPFNHPATFIEYATYFNNLVANNRPAGEKIVLARMV